MGQLGGNTYEHIGPTFLVFGNLINWLLHGVLTVQLYLYYLAFPKDRTWTKAAVYTVYALETLHVIGLAIIMAIVLLGNPAIFDSQGFGLSFYAPSGERSLVAHGFFVDIVGALVPLIAQFIYAHRIRVINDAKFIPWVVVALAVLQAIAAILTGLGLPISNCVWTGVNALNDIIIAVVMVRGLLRHRALSTNTRLKVADLVFLILATGMVTVAFNVIALVLFATQSYIPDFISTSILIFMPKLYANSILVLLNSRMSIAHGRDFAPGAGTDVLSTFMIADVQETRNGIGSSNTDIQAPKVV